MTTKRKPHMSATLPGGAVITGELLESWRKLDEADTGMKDPMTFAGREGGSVTMPREKAQRPGMAGMLARGRDPDLLKPNNGLVMPKATRTYDGSTPSFGDSIAHLPPTARRFATLNPTAYKAAMAKRASGQPLTTKESWIIGEHRTQDGQETWGTKTVRDGKVGVVGHGRAAGAEVRTREVKRSRADFLEKNNTDAKTAFDEAKAIQDALATEEAQRDHETGLAQIKADGVTEMAQLNATGKEGAAKMKELDTLSESMFKWQSIITDPKYPVDEATEKGYKALIARARKRSEELMGVEEPGGGGQEQPKLPESAVFTHPSGRKYKRNPDGSVEWL